MWRDGDTPDPVFTDMLELDLSTVQPCIAGPKRPQDRVLLKDAAAAFTRGPDQGPGRARQRRRQARQGRRHQLRDHPWRRGDRGHHQLHQHVQPLRHAGRRAGGAQGAGQGPDAEALGEDLAGAGLAGGHRVSRQVRPDADLDALGFQLVGYGCTTCIGNSGPLDDAIADAIEDNKLVAVSVLSGNRNFEGRVHPNVRANYLASPPLVVAYALLGTMNEDITTAPLGTG